jgi:hypothetical protein
MLCTEHRAELPSQMDLECNQTIIPCSTPPQHPGPQPPVITHTQEPDQPARDSPNFDFYNNCYSFPPLIYAFFSVVVAIGVQYTVGISPTERTPSDPSQLYTLIYLYLSVLAASVLCRRKPATRRARIGVWTFCFMSYSVILVYSAIIPGYGTLLPALGSTCLALLIFVEWKARREKDRSV